MTSSALEIAPVDEGYLAALFALRDLAGEIAAIDLADEPGLEIEIEALRQLVGQTVVHLEHLQHIDDPDPLLEWDELETKSEPDAWQGPTPARSQPGVADISFAGGLELKRVLRELTAAPELEGRLTAAESARRKVRRAIRATLEAAREGGVDVIGGEHQGHHQVADLASGLAVRKLYARFRRSIRRPVDPSAEAVLEAVRYGGGALATLVTSPDYADVRASDRAILRRLRERALQWARKDRRASTGSQLIEDLWTSGDLLRGINQRQELQHHDRELARRLVGGPAGPPAAWFADLAALFGIDDHLDSILDAAAACDRAELDRHVADAIACLARVLP